VLNFQADKTLANVEREMAATEEKADETVWWWERTRFQNSDVPGPCPEILDLTGPPRRLIFGPYLTLGDGRWRATAVFDLCEEGAKRVLALEFGIHPDCVVTEVPPRSGRHEIDLEFDFPPGGAWAELRVWVQRAAFDGTIRFHGVKVRRA